MTVTGKRQWTRGCGLWGFYGAYATSRADEGAVHEAAVSVEFARVVLGDEGGAEVVTSRTPGRVSPLDSPCPLAI